MSKPATPNPVEDNIYVKALQGVNLAAKDANGLSDPYLVILYGTQKFTSVRVNETLNPVWTDQSFTLVADSTVEKILVECWDYDKIGKHDFMGEFFVDVSSIPEDGTPLQKHFILEVSAERKTNRAKKSKNISGTIELELSKTPKLKLKTKNNKKKDSTNQASKTASKKAKKKSGRPRYPSSNRFKRKKLPRSTS